MRDYAKMNALRDRRAYHDVAVEARRMLMKNPEDEGALSGLAEATLCMGDYPSALPLYQRIDAQRRADPERQRVTPGDPGWRKYVAMVHWMLGNRGEAITLFGQLVDGILDGSVSYGDVAGGVQQGLMLYYMGVTAGDEAAKAKALAYLRTRAKRTAIKAFPGPVARYYLDEIGFADVLAAATERSKLGKAPARDVAAAIEIAREDLLARRFLCVALFHDGVKARARGDEAHCMMRMRECFDIENPLIELEWYLARFEVEQR